MCAAEGQGHGGLERVLALLSRAVLEPGTWHLMHLLPGLYLGIGASGYPKRGFVLCIAGGESRGVRLCFFFVFPCAVTLWAVARFVLMDLLAC